MKNRIILRMLILCLSLVTMLSVFTSCSNVASATTLSGYLIDVHCFDKKPDPALDSKTCLMMPACAATGYGIAVPQSDATYKFYYFDGEFAPAATGAQTQAASLINEMTKTDHLYVTVTGTLNGDELKDANGISYPVLTVESLVESNE